ncbi:hypothetical protein HDU76_002630 [Blyttiomyces sp. JEL0837]|nr:hypothetical protein HDU76_002630 [Blyttiomyces sp. JEL0837]
MSSSNDTQMLPSTTNSDPNNKNRPSSAGGPNSTPTSTNASFDPFNTFSNTAAFQGRTNSAGGAVGGGRDSLDWMNLGMGTAGNGGNSSNDNLLGGFQVPATKTAGAGVGGLAAQQHASGAFDWAGVMGSTGGWQGQGQGQGGQQQQGGGKGLISGFPNQSRAGMVNDSSIPTTNMPFPNNNMFTSNPNMNQNPAMMLARRPPSGPSTSNNNPPSSSPTISASGLFPSNPNPQAQQAQQAGQDNMSFMYNNPAMFNAMGFPTPPQVPTTTAGAGATDGGNASASGSHKRKLSGTPAAGIAGGTDVNGTSGGGASGTTTNDNVSNKKTKVSGKAGSSSGSPAVSVRPLPQQQQQQQQSQQQQNLGNMNNMGFAGNFAGMGNFAGGGNNMNLNNMGMSNMANFSNNFGMMNNMGGMMNNYAANMGMMNMNNPLGMMNMNMNMMGMGMGMGGMNMMGNYANMGMLPTGGGGRSMSGVMQGPGGALGSGAQGTGNKKSPVKPKPGGAAASVAGASGSGNKSASSTPTPAPGSLVGTSSTTGGQSQQSQQQQQPPAFAYSTMNEVVRTLQNALLAQSKTVTDLEARPNSMEGQNELVLARRRLVEIHHKLQSEQAKLAAALAAGGNNSAGSGGGGGGSVRPPPPVRPGMVGAVPVAHNTGNAAAMAGNMNNAQAGFGGGMNNMSGFPNNYPFAMLTPQQQAMLSPAQQQQLLNLAYQKKAAAAQQQGQQGQQRPPQLGYSSGVFGPQTGARPSSSGSGNAQGQQGQQQGGAGNNALNNEQLVMYMRQVAAANGQSLQPGAMMNGMGGVMNNMGMGMSGYPQGMNMMGGRPMMIPSSSGQQQQQQGQQGGGGAAGGSNNSLPGLVGPQNPGGVGGRPPQVLMTAHGGRPPPGSNWGGVTGPTTSAGGSASTPAPPVGKTGNNAKTPAAGAIGSVPGEAATPSSRPVGRPKGKSKAKTSKATPANNAGTPGPVSAATPVAGKGPIVPGGVAANAPRGSIKPGIGRPPAFPGGNKGMGGGMDFGDLKAPVQAPVVEETVGGWNVEKLGKLVVHPRVVDKTQLGGKVDLYGLERALRSRHEIQVVEALNILTVISHDKDVHVRLGDVPAIGEILITLLRESIYSQRDIGPPPPAGLTASDPAIPKKFTKVGDLLELEEDEKFCLVEDDLGQCSKTFGDARRIAAERALSILTIFRNLAIPSVENQNWLGKHERFSVVLFECMDVPALEEVVGELGEKERARAVVGKEVDECRMVVDDADDDDSDVIDDFINDGDVDELMAEFEEERTRRAVEWSRKKETKKLTRVKVSQQQLEEVSTPVPHTISTAGVKTTNAPKVTRSKFKSPFPQCAHFSLEHRRNAFIILVAIGAHVNLPSQAAAQCFVDVVSDLLQYNYEFARMKSTTSVSKAVPPVTNKNAPAPVQTESESPAGEDLQAGVALEALTKVAVNLKNADLLANCHGLDVLLDRCLRVLPRNGCDPASPQEELVKWEYALMALSGLAAMVNGVVSLLVGKKSVGGGHGAGKHKPSQSPVDLMETASCTVGSGFVPLLLAMTRRPRIIGQPASTGQQIDHICVRAMKVLWECATTPDARSVLLSWEPEIVKVVMGDGGAGGRIMEVEKLAAECIYFINEVD